MKVAVVPVPSNALPDEAAVHVIEGVRGIHIQVADDVSLVEVCRALTEALQAQADDAWLYVGRMRTGQRAG